MKKKSNIATLVCFLALAFTASAFAGPGAIFTTDSGCTGVNVNIFNTKDQVYLDGGPAGGGPGLPDGNYYAQVTTPNGDLLGSTTTASVVVTGGNFMACYQLSAILNKASDGSPGYDNTTNGGDEYKVWVSMDPTFPNSGSKTDNFKANPDVVVPPAENLCVNKFYDKNLNGHQDAGEPNIRWEVSITDSLNYIRFTPICLVVAPDLYTVTELSPTEMNWVHTTAMQFSNIDLRTPNSTASVSFGNVCLGPAGGLTLGFWSNKNGQKATTSADLSFLSGLNLRNGNGTPFDPGTTGALSTWLLNANATNMAYMLSAQLAAMELNVMHKSTSGLTGNETIYRPELNVLGITFGGGFITINNLMAAANTALADSPTGYGGSVLSGNVNRPKDELLKTALDDANNNKPIYVQPDPSTCPATFP